MSLGFFVLNKLVPAFVRLLGIKDGSWKAEKYKTVIQSFIMIPVNRIRGLSRTSSLVERQYDAVAGSYIQENYYVSKFRYSVSGGEIRRISGIENVKEIRAEIGEKLKGIDFTNVLEVGCGELTTLEDIYKRFGPELDCYGIDLSLNRLLHGLVEFKARHEKLPIVAKGNAMQLPFADNTFDLVVTRHTLEQMPMIYKQALSEIIRVSRKHIILFEPSFEKGTFAQKVKMRYSDYVRGMPRYLASRDDIQCEPEYLMSNSANPLNHTACFQITKRSSVEPQQPGGVFVCPIKKDRLELRADHYYSASGRRAYPIIDGVPVFDEAYSFVVSANHD